MRRTGIRLIGAVAAVFLAIAGAAVTAKPAAATPSECLNGANGFVDPSGATGVHNTLSVSPGTLVISLRSGKIRGAAHHWARMTGTIGSSDVVWLDWTRDGGNTWIQCGPFAAGSARVAVWTPAQRANPSPNHLMRACGRDMVYNEARCTRWY